MATTTQARGLALLIALLCAALWLAGCERPRPDFDGDGEPDDEDCAPQDATIYTGAPDPYGDGIDSDCDNCASGGDGIDRDCDGYPANADLSLEDRARYDCNDNDPETNPDATDIPNDGLDQDCDDEDCVDLDGDGECAGINDCDDDDPLVYLGAEELADCIDHDCDGLQSEGTAATDDDSDGSCEGVDLGQGLQCCDPTQEVGDCDDDDPAANLNDLDGDEVNTCGEDGVADSGDEDCDDGDDDRAPGMAEICDDKDNDCDDALPPNEVDTDGDGWALCEGDCDDEDASRRPGDLDFDGFSTCTDDCNDGDPTLTPVDADLDGFSTCTGECDDSNPTVYPGAAELCDGLDTDCDGVIPPDEADADGDGYPACADCDDSDPNVNDDDVDGDGWSSCGGDCDEGNAAINPDATDLVGDGIDQNCDGVDGDDGDGDGYASEVSGGDDCDDEDATLNWDDSDADGQASCAGDCDDLDPLIHGLDDDGDGWSICDGDCDDADASLHPHATEIPGDGIDQTCNGLDLCEDLNCDDWTDIVFSNNVDGATAYLDSWIYWGGPTGWSAANRTNLPTVGAGVVETADLDGDGYIDLVFGSHFNLATYVLDSYIYWGSSTGYSVASRTALPTIGAAGIGIADLDVDGKLDIFISNFWDGVTVFQNSYIYWGSVAGYSAADRGDIPSVGGWGNDLYDVDGDGLLDIVVANARDDVVYTIPSWVYYNSLTGYDVGNPGTFTSMAPYGVRAGDLDGDGFVDVVAATYWDGAVFDHDSVIHWGSAAGFTSTTALPTSAGAAVAIADLDDDGDDDLLFSCSNSGSNFEINSWIYWNEAGVFDAANRLGLPTQGAKVNQVADLDGDGWVDILFSNWRDNSGYVIDSYIYWGGPAGFSPADRTLLPTKGAVGVKAAGPGIPVPRSVP